MYNTVINTQTLNPMNEYLVIIGSFLVILIYLVILEGYLCLFTF